MAKKIVGQVTVYFPELGLSQIEFVDEANLTQIMFLDLGRELRRGTQITLECRFAGDSTADEDPLAKRYREEEPYRSRELT